MTLGLMGYILIAPRLFAQYASEALWFTLPTFQPETPALYEAGTLAIFEERFDDAADIFTEIIRRDSLDAEAWRLRGWIHQRQSDTTEALRDFTEAIRRGTEPVEAWYSRALLRAESGDTAGALLDLNQVLDRKPRYVEALLDRGLIRVLAGRNDEGCMDWRLAKRLGYPYPKEWYSYCTH